jgi:hypothetical protein
LSESPEHYREAEAWPRVFRIMSIDACRVDTDYQRNPTKIADDIVRDFDRMRLDPIFVNFRTRGARQAYVIDGWNRVVALKRLGEVYVPAMSSIGMTQAEEARHFVNIQLGRKNLTPLEQFKGEVVAGDQNAVAVARFLKRHRVETSPVSGFTAPPDALGAIDRVRRIYQRQGEDHLHRVFDTIQAAFPDERGRWQSEVIGGVSGFWVKEPDAHPYRVVVALVERIGSVRELLARSSAKRRGSGLGGGSAGYTVQVIQEAYRAVGRGPLRRQWEDVPSP